MIRKHMTCFDVSQLHHLPKREYICGPDCPPPTPGAVAYDAWAARVFPPFSMNWYQLPEASKQSWHEIAQAAIEAYKRLNVVVPGEEG